MVSEIPPFSLTADRYDKTTFMGRFRHFCALSNPALMFNSGKSIDDAVVLLDKYKNGQTPAGTSDAALWHARLLKESAVHPQTGERIPIPFRMSGFAIANVPIVAAMLLAPPTVLQTIIWQWTNQSYNAGFNYYNRNASNPSAIQGIVQSYFSACSIACVVALALNKAVKRLPNGGGPLGRLVPFVAVCAASSSNVVIMRLNEARDGVEVFDEHGSVVGKSQEAGKQALILSAATRCLIATPIFALPLAIMAAARKIPAVQASRRVAIPVEIAVVTVCLLVALPPAVSAFPQMMPIDSSKLEARFSELNGGKPMKLFYNKGV